MELGIQNFLGLTKFSTFPFAVKNNCLASARIWNYMEAISLTLSYKLFRVRALMKVIAKPSSTRVPVFSLDRWYRVYY